MSDHHHNSTSDLIAVTGAPGNVGTPLVDALVSRGAWVRVLARRPEHARAVFDQRGLGRHANLEVVHFDYHDRLTFVPALQGVSRLFVVRPTQLTQVENLMFPALSVALGAGVKRFVLLSILGAQKLPVLPHARLERHLQESGAQFTSLRPGYFLQNLTTSHWPELQRGTIFAAAGNGKASFIDARDIAEAAAMTLTTDEHDGKYFDLTGPESLSFHELAQRLSRAIGREITYTSANPLNFIRQWRARGGPLGRTLGWAGIYAATRTGFIARVSQDLEKLLGRPGKTVEEWAQEELSGKVKG